MSGVRLKAIHCDFGRRWGVRFSGFRIQGFGTLDGPLQGYAILTSGSVDQAIKKGVPDLRFEIGTC